MPTYEYWDEAVEIEAWDFDIIIWDDIVDSD